MKGRVKKIGWLTGLIAAFVYAFQAAAAPPGGLVSSVWAWGANDAGQLGIGNNVNKSTPTFVQGLAKTIQLAAGRKHTLALMEDGTVRAWGANDYGQLGIGNNMNKNTPTALNLSGGTQVTAGGAHSAFLSPFWFGSAWTWGANYFGQLGLGNHADKNTPAVAILGGVKQIAAGGAHTVALMNDGTV